ITLILLVSTVITGSAVSGQDTTYRFFPVNVSLIYPVSIQGLQSVSYAYNFSLNMLTGNNGSVDGFEVGGLVNINQGNMSGFQVAGIGNITHGDVSGTQIGGLFSMADSLDGLQINGIFGNCRYASGVLISGITNVYTAADVSIAGIANINDGDQDGLQLAGILNLAREVNGVQIGLINVADTIQNGIPIGLISFVKKGRYDEWSFTIADYMNLAVSYKLGLKRFYTIYTAGMSLAEDQLWVAGLGFGHLNEINPRFSIQPEVVWYTYFPMDFQMHGRETYATHFKIGLVRNLSPRTALSVAPSIYLSHKVKRETSDQYGFEPSPVGPLFDIDRYDNTRLGIGVGLAVAIHFR
ncbi:MAG: hypothetical protein JXQ80_08480, partial [Bacteroidales bacterium]|nr:hypothetical protein [Bacteroidales bacterium]